MLLKMYLVPIFAGKLKKIPIKTIVSKSKCKFAQNLLNLLYQLIIYYLLQNVNMWNIFCDKSNLYVPC